MIKVIFSPSELSILVQLIASRGRHVKFLRSIGKSAFVHFCFLFLWLYLWKKSLFVFYIAFTDGLTNTLNRNLFSWKFKVQIKMINLCNIKVQSLMSMRKVKCQKVSIKNDKVCMYAEMMTNDDNVESSLLTSSLLKIRSMYKFCRVLLQVAHVELEI